jgi:tetratricopeptide (TPR) repeat protein
LIFFWTLMPIQGFDIWFYLEVGRQVIEEFRIPWSESYLGTTDVFGFHRHANHAWLSYTICYLFYKFAGLQGLIALRSLLITATAAFTYLNCRQFELAKSWSSVLVVLVVLGVWTVRSRFLLRSVLFTDLLLAVLLCLLIRYQRQGCEKPFPYLALGLLFTVWTNTHQGVVVGCVCLFIWLLTRPIPWKTRFRALGVAGLSCFIRPYGWWYPLFFTETFGNSAAMSNVLEWAPLSLYSATTVLGPLILVILVSTGFSARKEGVPWGNLVLGFAFLFLAVRSQRAVGEVLPVVVPMAASFLALMKPNKKLLAPSILALCGMLYYGWLGTAPGRLARLNPMYPEGLIQELGEDHGQIFNSYEFGNYLVFRGKKPFIHGITGLFREQLVLDFNSVLNNGPKRDPLLERFEVEEVMIHHPTEVDSTEQLLLELFESPEWNLHWWDDSGYLFRKGKGDNLTAIMPWSDVPWKDSEAAKAQLEVMLSRRPSALAEYFRGNLYAADGDAEMALVHYQKSLQLKPNSYQTLIAHGSTAFQLGNMNEAQSSLEQAAKIAPSSAIAHFNLALLYLRQERYKKAKDQLETVLELDPDFPRAQELLSAVSAEL